MSTFDINSRLTKLRTRMKEEKVDAFIALKSVNVEYLTGFDYIRDNSDPHAVLVTQTEARFITDARYLEAAQQEAVNAPTDSAGNALWHVDDPKGRPIITDLHELWNFKGIKKVALEDKISYRIFESIKKSIRPAKVIPAQNWVEDIRSVKDDAELDRIKAAQAITDKAFTHLCSFIRAGMTEKEVALELEYTVQKLGAEGVSFPPIVASGANGSLPHAVPTDKVIEAGDLLTLDFGASYGGYCSDMTRTIFISGEGKAEPTDEQRTIYDTVLAAQEASLAAFKEGTTGIAVDKAGRELIIEAGYGDYFVHGTGHGVGLYIHEAPNASPRSPEKHKAGEVVTCEPGIYVPGKMGVRIEDMVIVTESSSENITTSSKKLIII